MARLGARLRLIIACIIFALWTTSVVISYHYGHDRAQLTELKTLQKNVAAQVSDYQKMSTHFDAFAKTYAEAQTARTAQLKDQEATIHAYLKNLTHQCRIDDRGVQLINSLIAPPVAARPAAGTERTDAMPQPTDAQRRQHDNADALGAKH